ncbi:hypothetical protein C8J57DRAFT_1564777 [Mycena rebaudengoi]|nr:hypothetical protein C8J57DRAFT_1564777 [Mycena rebaudengoi]
MPWATPGEAPSLRETANEMVPRYARLFYIAPIPLTVPGGSISPVVCAAHLILPRDVAVDDGLERAGERFSIVWPRLLLLVVLCLTHGTTQLYQDEDDIHVYGSAKKEDQPTSPTTRTFTPRAGYAAHPEPAPPRRRSSKPSDAMTVVRPPAAPLAPVVLPNRYAHPSIADAAHCRYSRRYAHTCGRRSEFGTVGTGERGVRVSRLLSPDDSIRGRRVGMRPSVARALATLPRRRLILLCPCHISVTLTVRPLRNSNGDPEIFLRGIGVVWSVGSSHVNVPVLRNSLYFWLPHLCISISCTLLFSFVLSPLNGRRIFIYVVLHRCATYARTFARSILPTKREAAVKDRFERHEGMWEAPYDPATPRQNFIRWR